MGMRRKRYKTRFRAINRAVASFVLASTICQPARGDELDDFRRIRDQAIAQYDSIVKSAIHQQRDIALPSYAELSILFARSLIFEDFNLLASKQSSVETEANLIILKEITRSGRIDNILSEAKGLKSLDKLIAEVYDLSVSIDRMDTGLKTLRGILSSVKMYEASFENVCSRAQETADPDLFVIPPPHTVAPENPKGIYANPLQFMDDELGRAVYISTISSTAATAIVWYLIKYGPAKFMELFTSGSIQLGYTGAGYTATFSNTSNSPAMFESAAGAMIAVAIVAMIAVEIENQQKKQEAKEAVAKLFKRFEEIRLWYVDNQIKPEEVRESIKFQCGIEEAETVVKAGFSNRKGVIWETRKSVTEFRSEIEKEIKSLEAVRASLADNQTSYRLTIGNYEQVLAAQMGEQFIRDHHNAIVATANVAAGWTYFNENVKPLWNRFSDFYSSHLSDCVSIKQEMRDINTLADTHLSIMGLSYKTSSNSEDEIWNQTQDITQSIKDRIYKRATNCKVKEDEIIPEDIPLL